jgi:hypothetical protein
MKKKILIGLGALVLAAAALLVYPHIRYAGQKSPLAWSSYEEGLAAARAAGKPILLKIYSEY